MRYEKYHYIISITCRNFQGRRERVRTPVNIFSAPLPPSKGGLARGKEVNKAVCVVRKMSVGRKCRQHDKSLPNYFWYYREIQKRRQHTEAPRPVSPSVPSNLYRLPPSPLPRPPLSALVTSMIISVISCGKAWKPWPGYSFGHAITVQREMGEFPERLWYVECDMWVGKRAVLCSFVA